MEKDFRHFLVVIAAAYTTLTSTPRKKQGEAPAGNEKNEKEKKMVENGF